MTEFQTTVASDFTAALGAVRRLRTQAVSDVDARPQEIAAAAAAVERAEVALAFAAIVDPARAVRWQAWQRLLARRSAGLPLAT